MGSDDLREGFVRQRRNLIGVSLALLFYQTTGLVVREINVFGNKIELRDPSLASVVLWVAWTYFLMRYYQHFHDTPSKGLSSAHHDRLRVLVTRLALKRYGEMRGVDPELAGTRDQFDVLDSEPEVKGSSRTPWCVQVRARRPGTDRDGKPVTWVVDRKVRVDGLPLRVAQARAWLQATWHTRFFTEYYLPFIVAAVPLAFVLWRVAVKYF